MYKIIKTTEYKRLTLAEVDAQLNELRDPRDLIREVLKITPFEVDFNSEDERYSDPSYQKGMANLSQNTILTEEIKKLRHEFIMNIATQVPKNEVAELVWTGGIDSMDILLNRLESAKEFLSQDQLNREDATGWKVK